MLFRKTPANDVNAPNTVIGEGMYLEAARMTGQESVRIDGVFKGAIEIDGSLVLGDSGSVTGDVQASYFFVAGEMMGNIECDTQLHFGPTARVIGDVNAQSLIIDEGSQVTGRYRIGEPKKQEPDVIEAADDDKKFIEE